MIKLYEVVMVCLLVLGTIMGTGMFLDAHYQLQDKINQESIR